MDGEVDSADIPTVAFDEVCSHKCEENLVSEKR